MYKNFILFFAILVVMIAPLSSKTIALAGERENPQVQYNLEFILPPSEEASMILEYFRQENLKFQATIKLAEALARYQLESYEKRLQNENSQVEDNSAEEKKDD